MASTDLVLFLTQWQVRWFAGQKYFYEGKRYFENGRVLHLERLGDTLKATIQGPAIYSATITSRRGFLEFECDCPDAKDCECCIHCTAAALAWLQQQPADHAHSLRNLSPWRTPKIQSSTVTDANIHAYVNSCVESELRSLVMELAARKEPARELLVRIVAEKRRYEVAVDKLGIDLERAICSEDRIHRQNLNEYISRVEFVLDRVEAAIQEENAGEIVDLCWLSIKWLRDIMRRSTDSAEILSGLETRVSDLHLQLCRLAIPDASTLALQLFEAELHQDTGVLTETIEKYAKVLGLGGRAAYRSFAVQALDGLAKIPGNGAYIQKVRAAERMIKRLDALPPDINEGVIVNGRELRTGDDYLEIAKSELVAGSPAKALEWAFKGKGMPGHADIRLDLFIAHEYQLSGRHEEALAIVMRNFKEFNSLHFYRLLEKFALAAGKWPIYREQALEYAQRSTAAGRNDSLLEILLYERMPEEAWIEAISHGCSEELGLRLAEIRRKEHPADAMRIYFQVADEHLNLSSGIDERAIDYLLLAVSAARDAGSTESYVVELDGLIERNKHNLGFKDLVKRNLKHLYAGCPERPMRWK